MITVLVNGNELSVDQLKRWEQHRLLWSARFLTRRLGSAPEANTSGGFAAWKLTVSEARMRQALKDVLFISSLLTRMMVGLSFGKPKLCVTEFVVQGCSAGKLSDGFRNMMLTNTAANRAICLAACPDHYLLKGCGEHVQEVIEVVGSMPLPLQFFVTYGEETGLTSAMDASYPFQVAGVARLKNGDVMGGVRHQMKDVAEGCAVRLTVEFPALLPNRNLREHQLHLACEFYHWFLQLQNECTRDEM